MLTACGFAHWNQGFTSYRTITNAILYLATHCYSVKITDTQKDAFKLK